MIRKISVVLGFALLVAACASSPTVQTDSNPQVDFSQFHSYTWVEDPRGITSLAEQRIRADVDAQLQAKGWTMMATGGQIGVVARVSTQQKQDIDTYYQAPMYAGWGWRGGWAYGGAYGVGYPATTVRNYEVGTLVVDLFDMANKQSIWRGTASKTVPQSIEQINTAIDTAIVKMFAKFPPGSAAAQ